MIDILLIFDFFLISQHTLYQKIHFDDRFDLLNVLRPLFSTHSWLNCVDEDDDEDEVGLKEKPEGTRYIKKITSK